MASQPTGSPGAQASIARHQSNSSASRIVPAIPLAFAGKGQQKNISNQKPSAPKPAVQRAPTSATEVDAEPEQNDRAQTSTPVALNGVLAPFSSASGSKNEVASNASNPNTLETRSDGSLNHDQLKDTNPSPDKRPSTNFDSARSPPVTQKAVRELPPPFYPSQQHSTASSVGSNSNRREQMLPHTAMHQPRPSANNLVFGGYRDSNNSSPAMPAAPGAQPAPQLPAQQVPGFPPPFVPGGHSYHYSEPHATQMYPQPMGPMPNAFGYPKENPAYFPPQHFEHQRQYYSPNPRFRHSGPRQNEAAFQPRYQPPAPHFYPHLQNNRYPDPGFNRSTSLDQRRMYGQHGPPVEQPRMPNGLSRNDSAASSGDDLTSYLHNQFGNADFSDYILELSHSDHLFQSDTLPAHGVLLARSPKLRSLIAMQHGSPPIYPKVLSVTISDKFLNREDAFITAVKRLYGEALLDSSSGAAAADSVRLSLAYAAAGHFLQVDEIITRGLDLAIKELNWQTVEMALAFSLDGGLSFSWSSGEFGEEKGSSSSIEDVKVDSPASAPTYGIYSERLLNSTVQFIVSSIPSPFKFAAGAMANEKSRLSQIRFGEMTIEDRTETPPDPVMTTISRVLLSLPFPVLKHILEQHVLTERLGGPAVAEIMRAVVDEREQRRRAALKSRGASGAEPSFEDRLLRNARWVEKVDLSDQHPSGFVLARHRSTADTPPSSDSTKS